MWAAQNSELFAAAKLGLTVRTIIRNNQIDDRWIVNADATCTHTTHKTTKVESPNDPGTVNRSWIRGGSRPSPDTPAFFRAPLKKRHTRTHKINTRRGQHQRRARRDSGVSSLSWLEDRRFTGNTQPWSSWSSMTLGRSVSVRATSIGRSTSPGILMPSAWSKSKPMLTGA